MILYQRERFARVDQDPKVSDSESEVLVDSHAARRIACVPVFVSLKYVVEEPERYLAISVTTDQSPTTKEDEDYEGQKEMTSPRHAQEKLANRAHSSTVNLYITIRIYQRVTMAEWQVTSDLHAVE